MIKWVVTTLYDFHSWKKVRNKGAAYQTPIKTILYSFNELHKEPHKEPHIKNLLKPG